MKITKIHYFFTAPSNMYWHKIGAEAEIIEGDDVRQCLYDLKRQVETFFYESKAAAEKEEKLKSIGSAQASDTFTPPKDRQAAIIQDISTCPDLKTLEAYRLIAKNNQPIQEAYDKKFEQLQNRPPNE